MTLLPSRSALLSLYARLKRPLPTPSVTPPSSVAPATPNAAEAYAFDKLESHFFSKPPPPSSHPSFDSISFAPDDLPSNAATLDDPPATLLGLDIGDRQIGVAVSDPTLTLAHPLPALFHHPSRLPSLALRIAALLDTHRACGLVVGLPLNHDGSLTPQAQHIQAMTARIFTHLPTPPTLLWWDESYSTRHAREMVREAGMDVRRSKEEGVLDSGAAAIILRGFLDHMQEVVEQQRMRLRHLRLAEKRKQRAEGAETHTGRPEISHK